MNIIDAVKSGKLFKRPGGGWYTNDHHSDKLPLTKSDILATDWEIEERKIEITEREFDRILADLPQTYDWQILDILKERLFT